MRIINSLIGVFDSLLGARQFPAGRRFPCFSRIGKPAR